jgi:hypothetical protein
VQPTDGHDREPARAGRKSAGADDAWARLWFALERQRDWTSLAVVSEGGSALDVARAIAAAGTAYHDAAVELVDASGIAPEVIPDVLQTIIDATAAGAKVVVAVDPPSANPSAIAVARAASAVLLDVPVGDAELARARNAVETIGRERFIGSVATRRAGAAAG